ncbi:MAG: hypothetical protein ACXWZS_02550 [Gemmatirosa sp.]
MAPGESLATIATKYGVVNWQVIYGAPCNAELRKRRPNATLIQPGDRVLIPPDERALLGDRLVQLRKLKVDTAKTFEQLEYRLQQEIARLRGDATALDMATGVALSFKGLVDIAKGGMQMSRAAAMTTQVVGKESRAIAGGHVTGALTNHVGLFVQAGTFDISGEDGDLMAGLKHVTKSFFDMTSPSYWAGRWRKVLDGQSPEQAFDDAVQTLQTQRQNTMIAINHRIRVTEQMLRKTVASRPASRR